MNSPALKLYHFPGACSRVSVCALEWAELPYQLALVNIAAGEQTSDDYRRASALGKVPALSIDGEPMLENPAILAFIDALRPDAGLFPRSDGPRARGEVVGGLSFCGGTLHPQVRGFVNPQRITAGDGEPVRERSLELLIKSLTYAERRIAERGWWLGDLSIVDVYLDWAFGVARRGGLETAPFPEIDRLEGRLAELPAYRRMQDIEHRSGLELAL